METKFEALVLRNEEINFAEDTGNASDLAKYVAPVLAFRRANGSLCDREGFLATVKPSGPRVIEVTSIEFLGSSRAFVRCIVSIEVDGKPKRFDNARLFVRGEQGDWQLMGWANEPL
jgi:hypothetical protein